MGTQPGVTSWDNIARRRCVKSPTSPSWRKPRGNPQPWLNTPASCLPRIPARQSPTYAFKTSLQGSLTHVMSHGGDVPSLCGSSLRVRHPTCAPRGQQLKLTHDITHLQSKPWAPVMDPYPESRYIPIIQYQNRGSCQAPESNEDA